MAGANLGTAWIQIKPSMRGMTSDIRAELSGVGSSEGQSFGVRFTDGFAMKVGAISGITQRVLGTAMELVSGQLDDAITRVDTLERFPKVMEMMGYSSEDAASAIAKLRDGVAGIPTSLADVVSGTQRIAALTGDVNQAADWTLALSDAMLVTTGDVNEASRGMQQFIQILSRGKPAGDDWNTVMEVASPVMNELARSLGFASASLGGDFYTALQKGTLSVDDMMAALVELDKNGGGGLTSLSERVKTATGGIDSSLTSLRQGVSNALVSLIETIGTENIVAVITSIKDGLVGVVGAIGNIVTFVQENWPIFGPIFAGIGAFFATVTAFFAAKTVWNGLTGIFGLIAGNPIAAAIGLIVTAITTLIMHWDEVKQTVETVFSAISDTVSGFSNWIGGIFEGIWNTVTGIFGRIGDFFGGIWRTISGIFSQIGTYVGEAISGAFKSVINGALRVVENFINGPIDIINGFISVINGAFGFLGVNLGRISRVYLPRMATGGVVGGTGTATSDSNLVALSKGEYVIRAAAARDIGYDNLNRLNATGELGGGEQVVNITINGYNKSPEELANIISRKIAFNQRGVMG